MWYFKKEDPRIAVTLMDGTPVLFEAVSWDTGVYPPEGRGISENLANQFRVCIQNQRGAITEINQQEYQALIDQKKNHPENLKRPEREEWRKQHRPEGNIVQMPPPLRQISQPNTPPGDAAGPGKPEPVVPVPPGGPTSVAKSLPTEIPRPTPTRREN